MFIPDRVNAIVPLPADADIVVNGDQTLTFSGDHEIDVAVDVDVTLRGFIGGGGLTSITIQAGERITVVGETSNIVGNKIESRDPATTISSRQVADGNDHLTASSTGCFGNILLQAPVIDIRQGVNLLAYADGVDYSAGNVTRDSDDELVPEDREWSFLSIDNIRWIDTTAATYSGPACSGRRTSTSRPTPRSTV